MSPILPSRPEAMPGQWCPHRGCVLSLAVPIKRSIRSSHIRGIAVAKPAITGLTPIRTLQIGFAKPSGVVWKEFSTVLPMPSQRCLHIVRADFRATSPRGRLFQKESSQREARFSQRVGSGPNPFVSMFSHQGPTMSGDTPPFSAAGVTAFPERTTSFDP